MLNIMDGLTPEALSIVRLVRALDEYDDFILGLNRNTLVGGYANLRKVEQRVLENPNDLEWLWEHYRHAQNKTPEENRAAFEAWILDVRNGFYECQTAKEKLNSIAEQAHVQAETNSTNR